MNESYTEAQLAAIESRSDALLLAANAGSGKTAVMVERFVRAVLHDGVDVARILAITFTEKAAAELRQRVRRRFAELDEPVLARETEGAVIATIHSLCARLLRANALLAGLDPRFTVLDQRAADMLTREAFEQALARLLAARGEQALDVVAAYRASSLRELVCALHGELRSRGQEAPRLPATPIPRPLGPAAARLDSACRALAAELAGAQAEPSAEGTLAALEACRELLDASALPAGGPLPTLDRLAALRPTGVARRALRSAARSAYEDAVDAYVQACADHHAVVPFEVIGELLALYGGCYRDAKRRRGALDFGDLELHTRALLREHPDVAAAQAARFAHVMVDEFQDTNALQLDIVDRIANGREFVVGDEFQAIYAFRHADVELFRDRAQTLASRRRTAALAESFRAHRELLDTLNAAYAPWFGEGFTPLRAAGVRGPADDEPPVELLITEQRGWEQAPDVSRGLPRAPIWRHAEARLLAQRVAELVAGGRRCREIVVLLRAATDIAVYERALEQAGLPTYVFGGRGYWDHPQVRDLVAYLAILANPLDELRLHQVLASPLVGVGSDALLLLADAAQHAGRGIWPLLAGGLPSTLAGELAPADAERLRAFAARFPEHRRLVRSWSLDRLIDRVVCDSGYDLAMLALPGGERRLANVRKLLRLAREFEAVEGHDVRRFVDYLDQLATEPALESQEGQAPVEGEALDAVRLMTVHRAKGLEFPVVCVADLGRQRPGGGRDLLLVDRDGEQVGLRLLTLDGGPARSAFAYDAIAERVERRAQEEERRLFYVAMTRAQDRLILSGAIPVQRWPEPGPRPRPLAWLAPSLVPDIRERLSAMTPTFEAHNEWKGQPVRIRCALNAPETVGEVLGPIPAEPVQQPLEPTSTVAAAVEPTATVAAAVAPPATGAPAAPASSAAAPLELRLDHLSYSSLHAHARCSYRFYLERILRLPRSQGSEPPPLDSADPPASPTDHFAAPVDQPALDPAARGTLIHALLERLDFATPRIPDERTLEQVAARQGITLTPDDVVDVQAQVHAFAASALCQRLAGAASVRREQPFAFALQERQPEGLLITGVVDVLGELADRTLIVDYKSDRLGVREPAEVVEREYAIQRLIYALAALRAGAGTVEVLHCFLERPDQPISATFRRAQRPALERRLRALTAAVAAGRFAVAADPNRLLCDGCPGRGTLCRWSVELTWREAGQG